MALRSDHKALVFVSAIAVLGTGVRALRASSRSAPAVQPALETQAHAADSAAQAQTDHMSRGRAGQQGGSPRPQRRGRGSRRGRSAAPDSTPRGAEKTLPMDRVGYVGGRLDLDVATAAQIDSLPGVTPLMAKRIVLDRMQRGPFLNLDGLKRVTGAGPHFIQQIDSLVMFSGTIHWPAPSDTVIPKRGQRPR